MKGLMITIEKKNGYYEAIGQMNGHSVKTQYMGKPTKKELEKDMYNQLKDKK